MSFCLRFDIFCMMDREFILIKIQGIVVFLVVQGALYRFINWGIYVFDKWKSKNTWRFSLLLLGPLPQLWIQTLVLLFQGIVLGFLCNALAYLWLHLLHGSIIIFFTHAY